MKTTSPSTFFSFRASRRRTTPGRCRAGFTLVEIMIVVLIIGLLAMIAIPSVNRALATSRLGAIRANLHAIDHVKTMWAAEWTNRRAPFSIPNFWTSHRGAW